MELAAADESYVSDADARVAVCRGGFPRGCRAKPSGIIDIDRENDMLPEGITVAKEVHLSVKHTYGIRRGV